MRPSGRKALCCALALLQPDRWDLELHPLESGGPMTCFDPQNEVEVTVGHLWQQAFPLHSLPLLLLAWNLKTKMAKRPGPAS